MSSMASWFLSLSALNLTWIYLLGSEDEPGIGTLSAASPTGSGESARRLALSFERPSTSSSASQSTPSASRPSASSSSTTRLAASSSFNLNHPRRRWADDVRPPVIPGRIRPIFNLRFANARRNNGALYLLLTFSKIHLFSDAVSMNQVYNDRRAGLYLSKLFLLKTS
jgi:hypothetical protein